MRAIVTFAIMAAVLMQGCITNTDIRSKLKRDYFDVRYKHILVIGDFTDPGYKKSCEEAAYKKLTSRGAQCTMSHTVPLDYSGPAYRRFLDESDIDAVLTVSMERLGLSTMYIPTPKAGHTGDAQPLTAFGGGDTGMFGEWGQFISYFFDTTTGDEVWVARVESVGNMLVSKAKLAGCAGSKSVDRLVENRVIN